MLGAGFDKRLHVSPFMAMDQRYTLRLSEPGETLSVHIESTQGGERAFDATLNLRRVASGAPDLAGERPRDSSTATRWR